MSAFLSRKNTYINLWRVSVSLVWGTLVRFIVRTVRHLYYRADFLTNITHLTHLSALLSSSQLNADQRDGDIWSVWACWHAGSPQIERQEGNDVIQCWRLGWSLEAIKCKVVTKSPSNNGAPCWALLNSYKLVCLWWWWDKEVRREDNEIL